MSDIIMRYEDYLIHTKHASDNTVASYMRDLRQYASYLGSEGVDVLDADQAVVSGYMGSMKAGGKSAATISRALASTAPRRRSETCPSSLPTTATCPRLQAR